VVKITEFKTELPQMDDFKSIVLNQTPLIDVRAPVEFSQGAFSSAVNLPLMNDEERQKVGLCYKENGNQAAVKLGHKLVNETTRSPRIQSWIEFMDAYPDALLYCFRGGMRSKISQQWLQDQGRSIVRLKGGYKAFRRFLIDYLDSIPELLEQKNIKPTVLSGRTGSGKTLAINRLSNALDLEGLAHHRGSAFGRHASPQPSQINFENNLAMSLMRLIESGIEQLIVEDEGRNIGSRYLSKPLFETLKSGSRIIVETSLEERVQITLDEYVVEAQKEYSSMQAWNDFMQAALQRIQKRLGGERYQRVVKLLDYAIQQQSMDGSVEAHQGWIETLLSEYYDPMYDYQMQNNSRPILFSGTAEEVLSYLNGKR